MYQYSLKSQQSRNIIIMLDYKLILLILSSGIIIFATSSSIDDNSNTIASSRGLMDAKNMLQSLAGSLMSRSYGPTAAGGGGSQVVSLNITNLLVIILLKALIFAAGSLGAGTWKGGLGRSNDGQPALLSEDEILLFLSYLSGKPGNNGCLQNIACQQPQQAQRYIAAGDMLLKATKMFGINPDKQYLYVLREMEQAAEIGTEGRGDCRQFVCESSNKNYNK